MANYSLMWGRKTPGHLVYLIDQSGSMDGDNSIKTAEAVHSAIMDTFIGCVRGNEVLNRVYITIIGYGNSDGVSIIREGWMTDYVADLKACKNNGTTIIDPIAYGGTPMAEALKLAKECLTNWIQARQEIADEDPQAGIPAPIVINITDGWPDDQFEAVCEAQELTSLSTPDGNVLLFNIHMDETPSASEIMFPSDPDSLNESGRFLFDISSEMTDEFIKVAKQQHLEGIIPGSKGFVVNAKGDTLVRFVRFGSSCSQG